MSFEKEEQTEQSRVLKRSEIEEYEGETIDIGEPKKDDLNVECEREEEKNNYSGVQFKVYQSNGSCLMILVVLFLIIVGLVIFLPLGLFILGIAVLGAIIRRLLN